MRTAEEWAEQVYTTLPALGEVALGEIAKVIAAAQAEARAQALEEAAQMIPTMCHRYHFHSVLYAGDVIDQIRELAKPGTEGT